MNRQSIDLIRFVGSLLDQYGSMRIKKESITMVINSHWSLATMRLLTHGHDEVSDEADRWAVFTQHTLLLNTHFSLKTAQVRIKFMENEIIFLPKKISIVNINDNCWIGLVRRVWTCCIHSTSRCSQWTVSTRNQFKVPWESFPASLQTVRFSEIRSPRFLSQSRRRLFELACMILHARLWIDGINLKRDDSLRSETI